MLIQGTNVPIIVTFDSDVSSFQNIIASLWSNGRQVIKWEKDQMVCDKDTIRLPLSENETRKIPSGKARLEIKGLNSSGQTVFWEEVDVDIRPRKDKEFSLGG